MRFLKSYLELNPKILVEVMSGCQKVMCDLVLCDLLVLLVCHL